jgi:hypothetical protein
MVPYISILMFLDRTVEDKTAKITEKDNIKPDLRDTGCGFSKSVKQTIHFPVSVSILAALEYCY